MGKGKWRVLNSEQSGKGGSTLTCPIETRKGKTEGVSSRARPTKDLHIQGKEMGGSVPYQRGKLEGSGFRAKKELSEAASGGWKTKEASICRHELTSHPAKSPVKKGEGGNRKTPPNVCMGSVPERETTVFTTPTLAKKKGAGPNSPLSGGYQSYVRGIMTKLCLTTERKGGTRRDNTMKVNTTRKFTGRRGSQ